MLDYRTLTYSLFVQKLGLFVYTLKQHKDDAAPPAGSKSTRRAFIKHYETTSSCAWYVLDECMINAQWAMPLQFIQAYTSSNLMSVWRVRWVLYERLSNQLNPNFNGKRRQNENRRIGTWEDTVFRSVVATPFSLKFSVVRKFCWKIFVKQTQIMKKN